MNFQPSGSSGRMTIPFRSIQACQSNDFFIFSLHFQPGWLQAGVKSEIPVLLRAELKTLPAAATLVTLLDPPAVPSRPVLRSFPLSFTALVSFVLACGGASSAPTPRLLRASLPLRRYVRRVGVGTWPRGAVFPSSPSFMGIIYSNETFLSI